MGGFHQKVSNVISSNKIRVNYLAFRIALARWLQEVVCCVLCCGCWQVKGNFVVCGTTFVLR